MAFRILGRGGIAVVELSGVIGGGMKVPVYSRLLDGLREDKRFRAVVLEIDSPGGTASGSELLYHSVLKIKKEKPVVAYIRGTGASGAYYISCAADRVVALPSALVGSIGVIYLRPVLEQLLQELGISFSVFKGGRLKDMGGSGAARLQRRKENLLVSLMRYTPTSYKQWRRGGAWKWTA